MLSSGQSIEIKGSAAKPYVVKNVDGRIWSCTCPAWRNSGGAVDQKICKHVRSVRGEAQTAVQTTNITTVPSAAAPAAPKLQEKSSVPPVLLAHSFEDADVNPVGWWMSEKLDGIRAYWDGTRFISRQGNIFHAPDWFRAGLPDHPLDGELWMGRQSFQGTMSIVRSQDAGERWRKIKYRVFDIPHLTLPFEHRMEELRKVCSTSTCQFLEMVAQEKCNGHEHLKQELDRLVSLGAEGLMIRQPGSQYESGRSSTILKVKPFKDDEAEVIQHNPGKGKHKGRMGGVTLRWKGVQFDLGTGFTDDDRKNPPPIGSHVTFRYTELTNDGIPKCASFVAVRSGY